MIFLKITWVIELCTFGRLQSAEIKSFFKYLKID